MTMTIKVSHEDIAASVAVAFRHGQPLPLVSVTADAVVETGVDRLATCWMAPDAGKPAYVELALSNGQTVYLVVSDTVPTD